MWNSGGIEVLKSNCRMEFGKYNRTQLSWNTSWIMTFCRKKGDVSLKRNGIHSSELAISSWGTYCYRNLAVLNIGELRHYERKLENKQPNRSLLLVFHCVTTWRFQYKFLQKWCISNCSFSLPETDLDSCPVQK